MLEDLIKLNIQTINQNGSGLTNWKENSSLEQQIIHDYAMADITCIQELKIGKLDQLKKHKYYFDKLTQTGKIFYEIDFDLSTEQSPKGGVAIALMPATPGLETATRVENNNAILKNRYLCVNIKYKKQDLYIHSIYAPVNRAAEHDKAIFFANLPRCFPEGSFHIIAGDFNIALDLEIDSRTVNTNRFNNGKIELLTWLSSLDVIDIYRTLNPTNNIYTGPKKNGTRLNRLDYIFISTELTQNYLCKIFHRNPIIKGDHLIVHLEMQLLGVQYDKGPWKLQNYLLNNPILANHIKETVKNAVENLDLENYRNISVFTRGIERRLKTYIKNFSESLSKNRKEKEAKLKKLLEKEKSNYRTCPNNESARSATRAEIVLENYIRDRRAETMQGGFDNFTKYNEKSTKTFFRPAIGKTFKTIIPGYRTISGEENKDSQKTIQVHHEMWSKLFNSGHKIDENSYELEKLLNVIERKLSVEQKKFLNKDLEYEEFINVIKNSPKGKTPGLDGLTYEFYQLAPKEFGILLCESFKFQLKIGNLLPEQRKILLSLIYKKGDRFNPKNYRPIALINTNVKILSRVLTKRLTLVIDSLIHPDQKGFIPGRSIHKNIMMIMDLQELSTLNNQCEQRVELVTRNGKTKMEIRKPTDYAVFLDFEKAYDRVSWEYLYKILETNNIGNNFISWVKLLLNKREFYLVINGILSPSIQVTNGLAQGDPISPLLYNLASEPHLQLQRREKEKFGIQLTMKECISVQAFADDTTLLCSNKEVIQQQLQITKLYEKASNALLNKHKTQILPLNKLHKTIPDEISLGFLKPEESCRYLGQLVGQNVLQEHVTTAFTKKLSTLLNIWKFRARTLEGRKLIVNTMILSTIWYYSILHVFPTKIINVWQRMINKFILFGYSSRTTTTFGIIAKPWLHLPIERGGLGIINIETTIIKNRLRHFQRCFFEKKDIYLGKDWNWILPFLLLYQHGSDNLVQATSFHFLFAPYPHRWINDDHFPEYWKSFLKSWKDLKPVTDWSIMNSSEKYIAKLNLPLWYEREPLMDLQTSSSLGIEKDERFGETRRLITFNNRLILANALKYYSIGDLYHPSGRWWKHRNEWCDFVRSKIPNNLKYQMWVPFYDRMEKLRTKIFNYNEYIKIRPPNWKMKYDDWLNWKWKFNVQDNAPFAPSQDNLIFGELTNQQLTRVVLYKELIPDLQKFHPIKKHFPEIEYNEIPEILKRQKTVCRPLHPVLQDIVTRTTMRILPGIGEFNEIRKLQQHTKCLFNCDSIETYQHLQWDCLFISSFKQEIIDSWNIILQEPPKWKQLITLQDIRIKESLELQHQVVTTLFAITWYTFWKVIWIIRCEKLWKTREVNDWWILRCEYQVLLKLHFKRLLNIKDITNFPKPEEFRKVFRLWREVSIFKEILPPERKTTIQDCIADQAEVEVEVLPQPN